MSAQKMIDGYPFVSYSHETYDAPGMISHASSFLTWMDKRRTVRDFADTPVPREVIADIIRTANTAPSGAHKQPWTFCAVQQPDIKKIIREEAEKEEYRSYNSRMSPEWLDDLKPLQTDWHKPFLEVAPWLIIMFKRIYEVEENGRKRNNYYVQESAGIAAGFLLAAIHNAGLVALTHTPSPMNFLGDILNRPENEKPFLLVPVGYPAAECWVPDIHRKPLEDVAVFY
ncbi:nitroreductase family protein [Chitinophaga nivalis]|uniref:Nitroreductase family protein n=1 Tax=Chitinophaga nivalis TaxID=2991709 RepID=A0ABT3ISP4_9BACT|nr:nitroreductase family protein [Chitinophaga nivalis]MCW3463336.1 nitroreductase family protein [Chitinophaga nivalis]MCW3486974.1 nitroreductase family protein [Chitinophaga nivalis]